MRIRTIFILTASGALAGLLIVTAIRFNLINLVRITRSADRTVIGWNSLLQRNTALGIVIGASSGGIGSLAALAVRRTIKFIRRAVFSDAYTSLFGGESEVNVIIPNMRVEKFTSLEGNTDIILPQNSPLLPASLAMSIASLVRRAGEENNSRLRLSYANQRIAAIREQSFIALAGPYVNELVKFALDHNLVNDFTLDAVPNAIDQGDVYGSKRDPSGGGSADAPLIEDHGFIIIIRNPWNPSKWMCILFGLWPQGTLAAVDAFLSQLDGSALNKDFRRSVRRGRPTLAVVNVHMSELLEGRPEFVKVRSLARR